LSCKKRARVTRSRIAAARQDRTVLRRIKAARFPVIKTLETFRWDWPKKINQLQVQDLFRLRFIDEKAMSSSSVYVASAKPT
jgi:DNA replication protein DnaC